MIEWFVKNYLPGKAKAKDPKMDLTKANLKGLTPTTIIIFRCDNSGRRQSFKDPKMDLTKANLKGLTPTTIITAEYDPLQSDGELLRDKLKDQKVEVTFENYDGVTHEFFGMAAIVPEAKKAQKLAVKQLKKHL